MTRTLLLITIAIFALSACAGFGPAADQSTIVVQTTSHIVKADSLAAAKAAVAAVNGTITHELGVIGAVAADLTAAQLAALREDLTIRRIYANEKVETAAKGGKTSAPTPDDTTSISTSDVIETHYSSLVRADALHDIGITGDGIGIAVLDTGLWKTDGIRYDAVGNDRINAVYNAIDDQVANNPLSGGDPGGHGSHIASIAVSSLLTDAGKYNGIAPGAHLVSVQAFDEFGNGTYADVIRAIDWVVANRKKHKIKILNLSFSAEARSHYWDDPINQAVMVAWQNEIFVVAAAGNRGPDPMTIGVPGNVPYVMTVGAMTDNFTPADGSDDHWRSFSSAGPTVEGFVKPEVVAPGRPHARSHAE